jgi:hypothetical protein
MFYKDRNSHEIHSVFALFISLIFFVCCLAWAADQIWYIFDGYLIEYFKGFE